MVFILAGWVMVVPITNVVKITLSVADILVEPIIGTPLIGTTVVWEKFAVKIFLSMV